MHHNREPAYQPVSHNGGNGNGNGNGIEGRGYPGEMNAPTATSTSSPRNVHSASGGVPTISLSLASSQTLIDERSRAQGRVVPRNKGTVDQSSSGGNNIRNRMPQHSSSQTPSTSLSSSSTNERLRQQIFVRRTPSAVAATTAAVETYATSRVANRDLGPYEHLAKGSGIGMNNSRHLYPPHAMAGGAGSKGSSSHRPFPSQRGLGRNEMAGNGAVPIAKEIPADVRRRMLSSGHSDVHMPDEVSKEAGAVKPIILSKKELEADAILHDLDKYPDHFQGCLSVRGCINSVVLGLLIALLLMLFAGYPVLYWFLRKGPPQKGTYGIGGTNGTGQVAVVAPNLQLIDKDTPQDGKTWKNLQGQSYHLVFSDEFETEGRTFWPGEDPFWEAVDIWYGATSNYEWYTPEQINTTGGSMLITLDNKPMQNLNFRSGMVQSWNKFCFQGGYIEMSVVLPGSPTQVGWWPGLWLEGNLCRAGYLGTSHGMWPYSYSGCDSGILQNQTSPGRPRYDDIVEFRGPYGGSKRGLSWLPGMRSPSCTCEGEDHPGPNVNTARSGPELDILEAQIYSKSKGEGSQSMQIGPFDWHYDYDQQKPTLYDTDNTFYNSYKGGVYQEALSAVSRIPDRGYVHTDAQFIKYGVDYEPDWEKNGGGRVTWYIDGKPTWTLTGASVPPRPDIDIGQRIIPVEPMSIIMNLGISRGFQTDMDFSTLTFPATLKIDYVRVYQSDAEDHDRISCDPPDHPTKDYIDRHPDVYLNHNVTVWNKPWPKNKLTGCGPNDGSPLGAIISSAEPVPGTIAALQQKQQQQSGDDGN